MDTHNTVVGPYPEFKAKNAKARAQFSRTMQVCPSTPRDDVPIGQEAFFV